MDDMGGGDAGVVGGTVGRKKEGGEGISSGSHSSERGPTCRNLGRRFSAAERWTGRRRILASPSRLLKSFQASPCPPCPVAGSPSLLVSNAASDDSRVSTSGPAACPHSPLHEQDSSVPGPGPAHPSVRPSPRRPLRSFSSSDRTLNTGSSPVSTGHKPALSTLL